MIYLLFIIALLCLAAFFSGMEIAYLSSDKVRLRLEKHETWLPTLINKTLFDKPQEYLNTILVGNTLCIVFFVWVFKAYLLNFSLSTPTYAYALLYTFMGIALAVIIVLVFVEILPKIVFRFKSHSALKAFSIPVFVIYILLFPLTKLSILIARMLTFGKFTMDQNEIDKLFDKKDLLYLADETDYAENEEKHEKNIRIFQNALDFSEIIVEECMIPRNEIVSTSLTCSNEDLQQLFDESGLSRILVYENEKDNIIGYVSVKDYFNNSFTISGMLRSVEFISEVTPASKQLSDFIKNKNSIAVVVDEFGGVAGVLTLEDLIEEILGDIEDEHDGDHLLEKRLSANEFVFAARLEVDYLNERYALNIPESEHYTTLAGFILFQNYSFPKVNDHIVLSNFEFTILKATLTRIDLVKMHLIND